MPRIMAERLAKICRVVEREPGSPGRGQGTVAASLAPENRPPAHGSPDQGPALPRRLAEMIGQRQRDAVLEGLLRHGSADGKDDGSVALE